MNQKLLKLSKVLFGMGLKKEASDLEALLELENLSNSESPENVGGSPGITKFSKILKLMPNDPPIALQDKLADYFKKNELFAISPGDLHITLLGQSVIGNYSEKFEGKNIPQYNGSLTYDGVYCVTRPSESKKSVFVVIKERNDLKNHVSDVLTKLDIPETPEENRIYHISLANANKKGSPFGSVGHSEANPIKLEDCEKIEVL